MKKKLTFATLVLFTIFSCNKSNSKEVSKKNNDTISANFNLIGKKAILTYPEFKAEMSYLSDSTLTWKTTSNTGEVNEGEEKVFYKKINDSQHFLNWIEKDGFTVSQIIDMKNGKVIAFGTFADDKSSRGKRSNINLEGTFVLVD